jgi:hypothetical protein
MQNARLIGFIPTRDAARARTFYETTLGLRFVSDDTFALVFESADPDRNLLSLSQHAPSERQTGLLPPVSTKGVTLFPQNSCQAPKSRISNKTQAKIIPDELCPILYNRNSELNKESGIPPGFRV